MKVHLAAALLAVASLTVACANRADEPGSRDVPASDRSTTSTVAVPPAIRFRVDPAEPGADLKQVAVDVVSAVGTFANGTDVQQATERAGPALAAGALLPDSPLLVGEGSAIEVIYAQLGGLTASEASVMVVLRHRVLEAGVALSRTRTVDVRLRREPQGPVVVGFGSFGGDPVEEVAPSPAAERVLADDRIELPDSARWDILAGRVDDRVLSVLSELSVAHRLSVTVLSSGHPFHVFATDDVSNHTKGRGVDIWGIDGRPVFSLRASTVLGDLVRQALDAGMTEVGAPVDVDGPGGASFSDTLHADHLHLAYDR